MSNLLEVEWYDKNSNEFIKDLEKLDNEESNNELQAFNELQKDSLSTLDENIKLQYMAQIGASIFADETNGYRLTSKITELGRTLDECKKACIKVLYDFIQKHTNWTINRETMTSIWLYNWSSFEKNIQIYSWLSEWDQRNQADGYIGSHTVSKMKDKMDENIENTGIWDEEFQKYVNFLKEEDLSDWVLCSTYTTSTFSQILANKWYIIPELNPTESTSTEWTSTEWTSTEWTSTEWTSTEWTSTEW